MNSLTAGRFAFGNADAIREVASDRSALWTGVALVLLTGIARNYDQNHFLETPLWLFGPLVFSFVSGSFLYLILIRGFARRRFEQPSGGQWTSFMAVFWMTAPIAWLYAIPVERFLDSYQAAQTNLTLLGIVSLWRVLLMSRALAVLLQIPFWRGLGWVIVAASIEVIVVIFLGALFGGTFGRQIMASMAGMRNAPEEDLLMSALSIVWMSSWAVLVLAIIALNIFKFRGGAQPLPRMSTGRMPWVFLILATAAWIGTAWQPQREQSRFVTHAALVEEGDYAGALAFLERHERSDFPPGRRLEPNPYEFRVWEDLPATMALVNNGTPLWIRELYLSHLKATLSHRYAQYDSLTNVAAMFSAIENFPEGREWVLNNQTGLARSGIASHRSRSPGTDETLAQSNILATFRRMGMAETNLNRIVE